MQEPVEAETSGSCLQRGGHARRFGQKLNRCFGDALLMIAGQVQDFGLPAQDALRKSANHQCNSSIAG
jgi:hypothetical protein